LNFLASLICRPNKDRCGCHSVWHPIGTQSAQDLFSVGFKIASMASAARSSLLSKRWA
jgi:hypothetical protein